MRGSATAGSTRRDERRIPHGGRGELSALVSAQLGPLSADVSLTPGAMTAALSVDAREHLERALALWAAMPRRRVEVPSIETVIARLADDPLGVLTGPVTDPVSAFLAWCRQPVDVRRLVTVALPEDISNYWAAAYGLVLPRDWAASELKRRARRGTLTAVVAVLTVVVAYVALLWQAFTRQYEAETDVMARAAALRDDLGGRDDALPSDLQLSVEGTGTSAHVVVSFSSVFDMHMQLALDTYARMPTVEEVPTLDEVRRALAADPRMAIWGRKRRWARSPDGDNPYRSVYQFISWCKNDAHLVHRETGDSLSWHVSNYEFALRRDDEDYIYRGYCYDWEMGVGES